MFLFGGISFKKQKYDIYLDGNNYTYKIDNEDIVEIIKIDDNHFVINPKKSGLAQIDIIDEQGNIRTFYATVNGLDMFVNELGE